MNEQELNEMLKNLQKLVDGNYIYVEDVMTDTGFSKEESEEIFKSINKLKSLNLK